MGNFFEKNKIFIAIILASLVIGGAIYFSQKPTKNLPNNLVDIISTSTSPLDTQLNDGNELQDIESETESTTEASAWESLDYKIPILEEQMQFFSDRKIAVVKSIASLQTYKNLLRQNLPSGYSQEYNMLAEATDEYIVALQKLGDSIDALQSARNDILTGIEQRDKEILLRGSSAEKTAGTEWDKAETDMEIAKAKFEATRDAIANSLQ